MKKLLLSEERAGVLWRFIMGSTAIWIGLGYAIGPPFWYRSPTLFVLQEMPVITIPMWGWGMVVSGILIFTPKRAWGHFIAFCVFGFWAGCIAVNAIANIVSYVWLLFTGEPLDGTPPIASWGGDALFLIVALIHAHQLLAPLAEKVDRESP